MIARPVGGRAVPDAFVSDDGREIKDTPGLLQDFGVRQIIVPSIEHGGVQAAPTGAVQDPAGSALGAKSFGAAGASGAIYRHFNGLPNPVDHLEFIPDIPVSAAIFNASFGQGGRVLHTHAPMLVGTPSDQDDRGVALAAISNAYAAALIAFDLQKEILVENGSLLNLVPVSAGIFAGQFGDRRSGYPGSGHLHPSYTLTAIALAASAVIGQGIAIPDLAIYYFDEAVRADAIEIAAILEKT